MRFYDTKQFCEAAKVSRQTMIKWQKLGLLAVRVLGQSYYFTQDDVNNVPAIKNQMTQRQRDAWAKLRKIDS